MEEIQNSVVTAVENLETYLQQFAQQNHEDFGDVQETLDDLSTGLSGALQSIVSVLTAEPLVIYSPSSESSVNIDLSLYDSTFEFVVHKDISGVGYNPSLTIYLNNNTDFKYVVLPDGTTFTKRGGWHVPLMCGVYKVVHV